MEKRSASSKALAALGILLAIGTILIVILGINATPAMLKRPTDAVERAEGMLAAVCRGDYETASGMLYGNPNLGTRPEDSSPVADLIWEFFLDSLEYELLGDCYAADSGLAIDIRIRGLDISEAIKDLDSRAQAILDQRVEKAEDMTEIYDDTNNFREEIVSEVLQEATWQVLLENEQYQECIISLNLTYEQDQWWVVPDSDLLNVLAGSISG